VDRRGGAADVHDYHHERQPDDGGASQAVWPPPFTDRSLDRHGTDDRKTDAVTVRLTVRPRTTGEDGVAERLGIGAIDHQPTSSPTAQRIVSVKNSEDPDRPLMAIVAVTVRVTSLADHGRDDAGKRVLIVSNCHPTIPV
jgi:hypothetical protein